MSEDAEKLHERIKKLDELRRRGEISEDAYNKLLKEYLEKLERLEHEKALQKPPIRYSYVIAIVIVTIILAAGAAFTLGYTIKPPETKTKTVTERITISVSTTIRIDAMPPNVDNEGIKINDDAEYANNSRVEVHFAAWDPISGLKNIYLSNDAVEWYSVKVFDPPTRDYIEMTVSWELSPGDGNRCVYLELEDGLGNKWWPNPPETALPYLRDCIKIDTTHPPKPVATAPNEGEKLIDYRVKLEWGAVSDLGIGELDHYIVELDTVSSFDSPNKKTYTSVHPWMSIGPLDTGTWYWRARAVDRAGNLGPWSEARSFRIMGNPDSDNISELAVWRPSNGYWYILTSATNYDHKKAFIIQWGLGKFNDTPLMGHVDSDDMEDLIIWRPTNGMWYILKSSMKYDPSQALTMRWGSGQLSDTPLLGDIDGDKLSDLIIWSPSNGEWRILKSSTNYDYNESLVIQWGSGKLGDKPLTGDIDGDGKDDLIIWRPVNGKWYILRSSMNYDPSQAFTTQWGSGEMNDVPLVGDVDGDGKGDLVIWRAKEGCWRILLSSTDYNPDLALIRQLSSVAPDDKPLLGYVDDDLKQDLIIWRPANGKWYIFKSSENYDQVFIEQWGGNGDEPLTS